MLETFWWLLTITCVVWYSTVTIYISFQGMRDIRGMLGRLQDLADEAPEEST